MFLPCDLAGRLLDCFRVHLLRLTGKGVGQGGGGQHLPVARTAEFAGDPFELFLQESRTHDRGSHQIHRRLQAPKAHPHLVHTRRVLAGYDVAFIALDLLHTVLRDALEGALHGVAFVELERLRAYHLKLLAGYQCVAPLTLAAPAYA